MYSQQTLLGVALLLLLTRLSAAATINTNTIISAENSFPGELVQIVSGASPPTVVQWIAGAEAEQLLVDDDSVLNMTGGSVTGALLARHSSRVDILGGDLGSLNVRFDSVVNLFDGLVDGDVRLSDAQGTPTFQMYGGRVEGDVLSQGANVEIHGGYLDTLFATGRDNVVNVTGGSFHHLSIHGNVSAHWSGGAMRDIATAFVYDDAVLHVYGTGLALDEHSFLTGTLLDGTVIPFNSWIDLSGKSRIVLHNVPESSTFALACVAALPLALLTRWRSLGAASAQFTPATCSR